MLKKEDLSNTKGFYQLPKFLFKAEKYKKMSVEAKTLYALIIDRVKLSIKNNWFDSEENVYIIFTNDEVKTELNCCVTTAIKVMKELKSYGLIISKRQGLCKPNLIYPQKVDEILEVVNAKKLSLEKNKDVNVNENITYVESNIENTQVDVEENNIFNNNIFESKITDEDELKIYEKILKENIYYDEITSRNFNKDKIDEILEIMLEVVTSKKESIKISKNNEVSTALFKSRILKINSSHIEYIITCINQTTTKIVNMKNYLLSTIYNAVTTMGNYYSNWVNSDIYSGAFYNLKDDERAYS